MNDHNHRDTIDELTVRKRAELAYEYAKNRLLSNKHLTAVEVGEMWRDCFFASGQRDAINA